MPPETRDWLKLTDRAAEEIICHRGSAAVTVGRFLAEAASLAAELPEGGGPVVNACADRYLALLGFTAALIRGHPTLLGAGRRSTPAFWAMAAERNRGAYALADTPLPGAPLQVLRLDRMVPAGAGASAAPPFDVPRIPPDRIVAIGFTSGSTGVPSAHPKPWGALVACADAAAERFGLRAADGPPTNIVATVPPQHMYGFETTMMLPLRAAVAVHAGETFFPSDVLAALEQVPARRLLITTPLHLRAMLAEGRRPPPLAAVISATAPLSAGIAEAVERDWEAPMLEIYGATEAGSMASRRTVRDTAWTPYRGVRIQPGMAVVPGIGEVPLADVLEPDCTGGFRLLGRMADLVKLGGKRASLAELNRTLAEVEGVLDGVFVAPEDIDSNPAARLSAYVVAPGRSAEEILGALRRRVDPVFLPRRVSIVPALPRDAVGKLPRQALGALAPEAPAKHEPA
jgi:acyl-coenzyme A synthetase/AMP-(fatty) acid ligase